MIYSLQQRDARELAALALGSKLFIGLAVDAPELYNSGWLSALLGTAFWLIVMLFCAGLLSGNEQPARHLAAALGRVPVALTEGIFAAAFLWEAAGYAVLLSVAADYATMTSIRPVYLILPLGIACVAILRTNGDGLSGAARIWLLFLPLFVVVILFQHAHSYNFRWLAPMGGPGYLGIVRGGLQAAGLLSSASAFWLTAEPEENRSRWSLTRTLLLPGLCAAVLLALHASMLPAQINSQASRVFQLDSLLSNGRASIASQLPMAVILLTGLLSALTFDLLLAATLLQNALPFLSGGIAAFLVSAGTILLALGGCAERPVMLALENAFFSGSAFLLLSLTGAAYFLGRQKRREKK